VTPSAETSISFACFGAAAAVYVGGPTSSGRSAETAAQRARRQLLAIHARLSRFREDSELSRLNADPRTTVQAGALLRRFARAVVDAGNLSGGLVDATLLTELETAGYAHSRDGEVGLGPLAAIGDAPARHPARPGSGRWKAIAVDDADGTIVRPPGMRLDSGGIAKGLAADLVGELLEAHPCYAVDCAGDLRVGGASGQPREIRIDDPFGSGPLASLELTRGGVATSGIGRRTWRSETGEAVAHHLLDPSTGEPAYTGVIQVTALAPTAFEAEVLAKTALLRGPGGIADSLPHGGLAVFDDRSTEWVRARTATEEAATG
jgi:FAD:protein FMN transferase